MERTLAQKLSAEFVGTFALIFIGAGSIVAATMVTRGGGAGAGLITIALAHGLAIGTMVSAVGHISGAHFNPAVTIAAWVTQKITTSDAMSYIGAQLAGGLAGAGLLRLLLPSQFSRSAEVQLGVPTVNLAISPGQAVAIEATLTFFLVWVIFATAIDPEGSFGKIAGIAIGLVVAMDIMMGGPFTGAAMNPARWFGPAAVGGYWSNWWVWLIGPIAGGIIAGSAYDQIVLRPRLGWGDVSQEEAPHGFGAHGDDTPPPLSTTDEM